MRKCWLNLRGKDLLSEPCRLLRRVPRRSCLCMLAVRCRFFGNGFRSVPGYTTGSCDFHYALGRDLKIALLSVLGIVFNPLTTLTAEAFRFRNSDLRKRRTPLGDAAMLLSKGSGESTSTLCRGC